MQEHEQVKSKKKFKLFSGAVLTAALCCVTSAVFADGTNLIGETVSADVVTGDIKATAPTAVKIGLAGMAVVAGVKFIPKAIRGFIR